MAFRFLLPYLFLAFCSSLFAQEALTPRLQGRFLTLGLGVPIHTVKDQLNSPLVYRGRGWTINLELEEVRENWTSDFRISIAGGPLKARVSPRRDVNKRVQLDDFRLNFGLYRGFGGAAGRNDRQYAGLSVLLQVDNRRYPLPANNVQGTHFRLSGRAGFVDRRELGSSGRWGLVTRLDVPFITKLYRPTYIGIGPFLHRSGAKGKDFWRGMPWGSFGLFSGFDFRLSADYRARSWRTDRIDYQFIFGHTPLPRPKALTFTSGRLGYGYRVGL